MLDNKFISKISEEVLNKGNEHIYEKVGMAPTFSNCHIAEISTRFKIYNDYKVFENNIDQFIKDNNGYHRVLGEMIKVDHNLGGNGLGYSDGSSHSYILIDGRTIGGTKLPSNVYNEYITYGKNVRYINYSGHHIYPQSDNNYKYDPDNLILLKQDDNSNLANIKPINDSQKADNTARIRASLNKGNLGKFFYGLLMTVFLGFFFGFLISVLDTIINRLFIQKVRIEKEDYKKILKNGLENGIYFSIISLVLYLLSLLFYWFIFGVLRIDLSQQTIYIISIMIFAMLGCSIQFIMNYRNNKSIRLSLKKCQSVLIMIALGIIVGLANGLLPGWWKILGFMLSLITAISLRFMFNKGIVNNIS